LDYKFTGKEQDNTGFYYFGARYYDPQTSLWISTDPILGKYIDDVGKAKQNNDKNSVFTAENGGMDGALNSKNLALYSYASQNPIIFTDPNGLESYAEMCSHPIDNAKFVKPLNDIPENLRKDTIVACGVVISLGSISAGIEGVSGGIEKAGEAGMAKVGAMKIAAGFAEYIGGLAQSVTKGYEVAGGVLSSGAKKATEAVETVADFVGAALGNITSAGEILVKSAQAPNITTKDSGGPQPQIIFKPDQTQNMSDYGY
jgi:hypothetical protein